MNEVIRITVPFDINRCSPNHRLHYLARARLMAAARQAGRLAWMAAGSPQATVPVQVSLVLHRARAIDQGNAWAAAKGAIDGVFVDALTPDDGPKWVTLGSVVQETGRQWKGREECVFVVTAAERRPGTNPPVEGLEAAGRAVACPMSDCGKEPSR